MTKSLEKSVGRALLVTARLHRARMGERLNALGLFPGQEQALKSLQTAPMTMGELATLLRVKPPTVSKTIGRLSLQGLVTREGGGRDGRLVQVALTDSGQKTAAALDAVWNQVEEELLEKLDEGAQATAQIAAQGVEGTVQSRRRTRRYRRRGDRKSVV